VWLPATFVKLIDMSTVVLMFRKFGNGIDGGTFAVATRDPHAKVGGRITRSFSKTGEWIISVSAVYA